MLKKNRYRYKDTYKLSPSARSWNEQGAYTFDAKNTKGWYDFWTEERRRCVEGYEAGGIRITGDHYFYLNYCPIMKVVGGEGKTATKAFDFPDFWDGDRDYFWSREIAKRGILECCNIRKEERERIKGLEEEDRLKEYERLFNCLELNVKIAPKFLDGGYNLIVGKSRRKGYSYKSASIAANNYFSKPRSLTILAAFNSGFLYPSGIFTMAYSYINFINKQTAWTMPTHKLNKPGSGHIKSSYIEIKDGSETEEGFKSEILCLTFGDNKDAARGKDATDIFFEESGAFGTPGHLIGSYIATQDCVRAGSLKTGLITVFGTSGNLSGGSLDYSKMVMNPESYGFLPFYDTASEMENEDNKKYVGFCHSHDINFEGFYDKDGNSDVSSAKAYILAERKHKISVGATSSDITKMMQENPLNLQEAFTSISINNFPTAELNSRLAKVNAMGLQETQGMAVDLFWEGGKVFIRPILNGRAEPITSYYSTPENKRGCVVMYEMPVEDIPRGLYKIGYDPVAQDKGTSLAAIIVYKSKKQGDPIHDIIAAEYIGRRERPDDIDRIADMLAEVYNAQVMYENNVPAVKLFFENKNRLHRLALSPKKLLTKNASGKYSMSRVYGCHMTESLKDAGERFTKEWLLDVVDYDEYGNPIHVYDRIYSKRLLEELIEYNRNGNFDMVSALFMCLFQRKEDEFVGEYKLEDAESPLQVLIDRFNNYLKIK